MRIAMPVDKDQINQHFGRSREFAVIEVENGVIKDRKNVSAATLMHNHEGLAGLMRGEAVDVVITGGIGARALTALEESGLKVVTGAAGSIDDVVAKYTRGELGSSGATCCHHHDEHGHNCHH